MTTEEALRRWGLVPALSSLQDIRRELVAESHRRQDDTSDRDENDDSTDDLLLLLCVQLFAARQLEDSLHIWRAKQGDFDASLYIDGELLCGADVEETKQYLRYCGEPEALTLLKYIEDNDWNDFTPDKHLAHYRSYFST